MSKIVKARHWAFVAYPESVAPDWLDQLKLSGLKCAISPLHDKDVHSDPAVPDGKKPHWHVIVCYDGPVTAQNVTGLTVDKLRGTIPVRLESVKGYFRYFTHADDPDKYQYDLRDIKLVGGFDIMDHVEMSANEKFKLLWDVQTFIDDHNIMEYGQLLKMLKASGDKNMWRVAASNTLMLNTYISSIRNETAGRVDREDRKLTGRGEMSENVRDLYEGG